MHNETNQLELADLDVRMTFPEGVDGVAAQLAIICRKANLTIARIDMTPADLVNFYTRRSVGKLEGETRLLSERGRAHLNNERVPISVQLPFAVDVFEDGDPDLIGWSDAAARAYAANDFRITRSKAGYTVSLMYFVPSVGEKEQRDFEVVRQALRKRAEKYAAAAIREKGRVR